MNLTTVVLTIYKRPDLLEAQLDKLKHQTFHGHFKLIIINNGGLTLPDDHGADSVLTPTVNLGMAARLMLSYDTPSVILLDDDIDLLEPDAIEKLYNLHLNHNNCPVGWYAWRFIPGEGYWTRHRCLPGEACDYLGNSFVIYPADFINQLVLPRDPMSINGFDDLWLSFQAYRADLTRYACESPVQFIDDGLDTSPSIAAYKIEVLDDYRSQGWNV